MKSTLCFCIIVKLLIYTLDLFGFLFSMPTKWKIFIQFALTGIISVIAICSVWQCKILEKEICKLRNKNKILAKKIEKIQTGTSSQKVQQLKEENAKLKELLSEVASESNLENTMNLTTLRKLVAFKPKKKRK